MDSQHPALIPPQNFERLRQLRDKRDLGKGKHTTGRPSQNHALAKLAVCGQCHERLYAVTSSYRRKDGSRARSYVCHNQHFKTGVCDAKPIDAEYVDRVVLAGLDTLLVDFDGWRTQIEDRHAGERTRLADEVAKAQRDHNAQATKTEKVEAKWSEYVAADDSKADTVLSMVEQQRLALTQAQARLTAAQDALATIPTEAPTDAMLDFANALQEAVRGRLDETNSLGEVNAALRDLFEAFVLREVEHADTEGGHWKTRADGSVAFVTDLPPIRRIFIQPFLLGSVGERIIEHWHGIELVSYGPGTGEVDGWEVLHDADQPPPPLRWLSNLSKTRTTPTNTAS